jgi:pantoate--beta-alanine ligase
VSVDSLTIDMCGSHRPGHFDGVTTVVAKLLNQAQPDYAVFGEKDWQQLAAIRRMVRDLDMPIRIVSGPTVREADGLAMSSRNRYLTSEQRAVAAKLNRALFASADHIAHGISLDRVLGACRKALLSAGFDAIDYLDVRDAQTLENLDTFDPSADARLFVAARLGKTRLIDNVPVERTGLTE